MTKDGARRDGKPGGYSRATIKKTQDVLSSVLRTATEWETIEKNPMDKVRTVGERAADKLEFFTPEQAAAFLDYIERPYTVKTRGHSRTDDTGIEYAVGDYERTKEVPEQLRVLFNLAIYAGLRKGELLALEWSDVDFENDTVTVSKTVSVVAGKQITKEPKTKTSRRTVSIPHFLTQRIKALRRERLKYRLTLGDYWQGGEWLFIQENGRLMGYSTPYSAFQDAITRYNADKPAAQQLPAIPFHGLRQYLGNPADCRETGCSDSIKPAWTRTGIHHHEYLRPRIVGNRPQGVKCAGKYACGESTVIAEKAARSKNRTAFLAIKAEKILQ